MTNITTKTITRPYSVRAAMQLWRDQVFFDIKGILGCCSPIVCFSSNPEGKYRNIICGTLVEELVTFDLENGIAEYKVTKFLGMKSHHARLEFKPIRGDEDSETCEITWTIQFDFVRGLQWAFCVFPMILSVMLNSMPRELPAGFRELATDSAA